MNASGAFDAMKSANPEAAGVLQQAQDAIAAGKIALFAFDGEPTDTARTFAANVNVINTGAASGTAREAADGMANVIRQQVPVTGDVQADTVDLPVRLGRRRALPMEGDRRFRHRDRRGRDPVHDPGRRDRLHHLLLHRGGHGRRVRPAHRADGSLLQHRLRGSSRWPPSRPPVDDGARRVDRGYLERGEYNPSLELALRIAEHFGLPVEAIFSRRPFVPMSEQLYADGSRREMTR